MSPVRSGEDLPEGVFHLISAHEVAPERWRWRLSPTYVAVCGARVQAGSLEGTDCPNECECEFTGMMAYCPDCLRAALRQNDRAGVEGLAALGQDGQRAGQSHG
ncbi:MAG: hypothetical protein ACRDRX_07765 [Pseudonocardiaceae bacterium]